MSRFLFALVTLRALLIVASLPCHPQAGPSDYNTFFAILSLVRACVCPVVFFLLLAPPPPLSPGFTSSHPCAQVVALFLLYKVLRHLPFLHWVINHTAASLLGSAAAFAMGGSLIVSREPSWSAYCAGAGALLTVGAIVLAVLLPRRRLNTLADIFFNNITHAQEVCFLPVLFLFFSPLLFPFCPSPLLGAGARVGGDFVCHDRVPTPLPPD